MEIRKLYCDYCGKEIKSGEPDGSIYLRMINDNDPGNRKHQNGDLCGFCFDKIQDILLTNERDINIKHEK